MRVKLQVILHTGLQLGVLADGNGDDEKREGAFQRIVVVEQFDDVLSLNGLDTDAAGLTNVYTFLD